MARRCYRIWNTATGGLTAAPAFVATGTSLKTMLQVKPLDHAPIIGYGWRFETDPVGSLKLEVLTTGTINATVTASVAGDIVNFDPLGPASTLTLATSGTGYTSSGEGSIVSTRLFDVRSVAARDMDIQFPLDREYACGPAHYLRMRVTAANTINMLCYFDIEL
jgi:hypothetical protein